MKLLAGSPRKCNMRKKCEKTVAIIPNTNRKLTRLTKGNPERIIMYHIKFEVNVHAETYHGNLPRPRTKDRTHATGETTFNILMMIFIRSSMYVAV